MTFPTYTNVVPTEVAELVVTLRYGEHPETGVREHTAVYRLAVLDQNGKLMRDFNWVEGDLVPYLEGQEAVTLRNFIDTLVARAEAALGIGGT